MTTLQELSAGIEYTEELMDILIGVFRQMHACTTKEELFSITRDENLIVGALEHATTTEAATLLLSCINLESEHSRTIVLEVLPKVKSLEIAELIVDKFNTNDIAIDFTNLPGLVPYCESELDLQLVTYFIRNGGNPGCFTSSYLQALCSHDLGLRVILQPYINEQLEYEAAHPPEYDSDAMEETDDNAEFED